MDIIEVKKLGIHTITDWNEKNENYEIINFSFKNHKTITRYSSVFDGNDLLNFKIYYVISSNDIFNTNISEIKLFKKDYKIRLVSKKDIKCILILDFLIMKYHNYQEKFFLNYDDLDKLIKLGISDYEFNNHKKIITKTPGFVIEDNFRALFEKNYPYKNKKVDENLPF